MKNFHRRFVRKFEKGMVLRKKKERKCQMMDTKQGMCVLFE